MKLRDFEKRADWAILRPTAKLRVRLGKKPFSRPLTVESAVFLTSNASISYPLLLSFEGGPAIAVVEQDFELVEPAGEDVPVVGDVIRDADTGKLLIVTSMYNSPASGLSVGGLNGCQEYLSVVRWSPAGKHIMQPSLARESTWTLLFDGEGPTK
jgi:hypothetical protein